MTDLSFLTKERLHTGFGQNISTAKSIDEALDMAGLNWNVEQKPVAFMDSFGKYIPIENQIANIRVEDNKTLGIVTGKYKVCQNREAFDFLDNLVIDGSISFTMAGSFRGGRAVWIQGIINGYDEIQGDEVVKYVLFVNSHDGTGSIRTIFTPTRLICSNAINFAIKNAFRSWSCVHTGNISDKLVNAQNTLLRANDYMVGLKDEIDVLSKIKLSDKDVQDFLFEMYPESDSLRANENALLHRELLYKVYETKPDLVRMDKNGYRFLNAVSDYVSHSEPKRNTKSYNVKLFEKVSNGHPIIDKAYSLVKSAA